MLAFVMRWAKVAVLAALAIGLAPSVSQADTGSDASIQASVSCTAGRLCIYKDTNFNGLARRFTVNENDYRTVNWWNFSTDQETSDEMDNNASSVINKTGGWVRLYQDVGYQGQIICLGNNSSVHRLGIFPFGNPILGQTMDDRVSAHAMNHSEGCDFRVEPNQNL
jgi:hypothetical protein